jgi:ATP-dependent Lon protease
MPRDNQNKVSKKDQKLSKKQEDLKKKKIRDSDSDGNDGSDSEKEEMDMQEYRKFISKIFPSKHINDKIKAGEKLKKVIDEDDEDDEDEDWETESEEELSLDSDDTEENSYCEEEEEEVKPKSKKNNKKDKKKNDTKKKDKKKKEESEDEEEEDEEFDGKKIKTKNGNLNIILTVGGVGEEEDDWNESDYDPEYDSDDDELNDDTEDEDEEVSSDESSSEDEKPIAKNKYKVETITEGKSNETLDQLRKLLEANPKDKSIQKCIEVYENDIKKQENRLKKKEKKQKNKNMRIFRKIIKDKNTMNDFAFYEKLDMNNQKKVIKELREINKITRIEKPYRMTLLESDIPVQFKSAAMKKINSLRYMEPGSGEFYKIKNWVDTFMRVPFTKYEGLPISIDDGVDKCHEFMENAQKTLDKAVYGLNDAKMQIMQMLGQLLTNPKAIGTAIAIHGPPGTGKTSLVKEGISKILNRPFAFIALGGATDSSFLEGHGYTYEGSTWGKIVQILIDSKCMNPVIYFDELDKISDTPKGEEITGILTHLTDTSQNTQFHDKYFAEINFDISKCLFIFSYNDESKVNPILKDRMYRIKTKGYVSKEKTVIANNYLLPKIKEQVRFNEGDIIIADDVIGHIIDSHCNKEDGVRNLKRCLEIIYTKINLYRLMKPGSNLFENEMSLKVEFPFKVTKEIVDKLIKKEQENNSALWNMYI